MTAIRCSAQLHIFHAWLRFWLTQDLFFAPHLATSKSILTVVDGQVIAWIESYLKDREQFVQIENTKSLMFVNCYVVYLRVPY